MPKFTRSFITGSWAYGSPRLHEDNMCEECEGEGCENCRSDIDLVTLVSKEDFEMLLQESDYDSHTNQYAGHASLRFGKLNLLCQTDEKKFSQWKLGTKILIQLANLRNCDISREEAVAMFDRIRELDYEDWWNNSREMNKITAKGLHDGIIRKLVS